MTWRMLGVVLVTLGLVVLGACLTQRWWEGALQGWIFDAKGNFFKGGWAETRSHALLIMEHWIDGGWFWAPLLMILGAILALARPVGIGWCDMSRFSLMAAMAGLSCTAVVVAITLPFFSVPPGTEVRPMGWVAAQLALGLMALIAGLPLGIIALFKDRRRWPVIFAVLLCLAPVPVADGLFHLTGLVLAD
jgi:hypothetical protein